MDAKQFTQMISNKDFFILKKMQYKYSADDVKEMLVLLNSTMYETLPIKDFEANALVYLPSVLQVNLNAVKSLLTPQSSQTAYGLQAMEEEIHSTLTIENIESSRDSIRKILQGYAPANDSEERIYGMKKGLEFISDTENKITEENLHKLYQLTVGNYLTDDSHLPEGQFYRNDTVYIVGKNPGRNVEHQGLPHEELPRHMGKLIAFANAEDSMNDLLKAAAIHFYIGYIHPYFDGNGRTARLVHLWYLVQRGYSAAMFTSFSSYINESRKKYYNAFSLVEENAGISKRIDITPFLAYFIENVYDKLGKMEPSNNTLLRFESALSEGKITEKEKALWNFVLSAYGTNEFSTKQLERDFGDAAYATIRSFVIKFEKLHLLKQQKYGSRVKYSILST